MASLIELRKREMVSRQLEENLDPLLEKARRTIIDSRQEETDPDDLLKRLEKNIRDTWPGMSYANIQDICKQIEDELLGWGILEELRHLPGLSDIVCINSKRIAYQQNGVWHWYKKSSNYVKFRSPTRLRMLILHLCMAGRAKLDETTPYAIFSVGGMRVTAVLPPVFSTRSQDYTLAIRLFPIVPDIPDLISQGSLSPAAAELLKASYKGPVSVAFVGPRGTGKTTNIASAVKYMNEFDFPILIEGVRECPVDDELVRVMVCRPANIEGKGAITYQQIFSEIVLTSMGETILMSEARGGEVLYMLQMMHSGHRGMLCYHAQNAYDAVNARLPGMLMQNKDFNKEYNPHYMIGDSVDLICVLAKYGPQRRFKEIAEISFNKSSKTTDIKQIFVRDEKGDLVPTGYQPQKVMEKLAWDSSDPVVLDKVIFKK